MSTSNTDADVALPHASLLAYFRGPSAVQKVTDSGILSSDNSHGTNAHQLLHPPTDDDDDDEESRIGFWGEVDGPTSSSGSYSFGESRSAWRGAAAFCCLWCAFSVMILGAFSLYFAVNLVLGHYGLGTGMAEWVMYRQQLPPSNIRGAWHYLKASTDNRCTTDTIDFILNPKEAWKVQPDAILLVKDDVSYLDQREQTRAPAISREEPQAPKLGDDVAEEGQLGRTV
ncbi:hypothetical protein J4E83_004835 [Alternaria metachromatica]|uniref:uncharacterized protein n=1 Tax=Alternaria metachromatica TaxID=283354 RepID=UPI0020C1DB0C|nr:uncharacterized protein J4E83_004835 [Alternaria metachromatica]KAI4622096.1 hypothetical protein J4E83_004835 [Alternaria metachromatica]